MRFPLLLMLLLLIGCSYTSEFRLLDEVDSLVAAEKYDSAYHEVMKLNPPFDYERDLAHYRLLLVQTSYLTDNTLQTDSVIDSAISYYEHSDNLEKLADAYYYKAACLQERNEDKQAILFFKKAEDAAQKLNNLRLRYKIAESMVRINDQNGNYHLQLDYARKALGYALESGNKNWIAYSYFNLSNAFQYFEEVDSLTKYSKELIPRLGDIYPQDLPHFLNNIGFMYIKNGDTAQARKYYVESLSHKEIPNTLVGLAEVCIKEGNDDEAYKLWQKAFLMDDDGTRDIIMFNMLQYDLKHRKNIEDACERMYRIYAIKDSMTSTLKDRTIQEMQQRYDEEAANHLYEHKLMKWMIATLILVVLLLLLMGYVGYKRNRSKLMLTKKQMLINQHVNEIKQMAAKCSFAEREIMDYKTMIDEYKQRISQLESSGKDVEKEVEELKRRIEESVRRNEELEASCTEARSKINSLREEITDIVEKASPILNRGKILYEGILQDQSIAKWSKNDRHCFMEYYKALHINEYESIVKKYKHLTMYNMFFLILNEMGKDSKAISQIMGISQDSLRTIRYRIRTNNGGKP